MEFLSTLMMVSLVGLFLFALSLQELQEVVDKDTISSNDEDSVGRRTRSVLNSNSGDCDSGEVSKGDEKECSCGESDLVHMDSRVLRQLQLEETSFDEVLVLVGVLVFVLCFVDFLGEEFGFVCFGVFEGEVLRSLVK